MIRSIATALLVASVALAGCDGSQPDRSGTAGTAAVPPTTAPVASGGGSGSGVAGAATTLPLGRVGRLDAVQFVGGSGIGWAVGQGTILATSDGGRRWGRVWRGAAQLRDLDFVSARTGWALGDGLLLGSSDGGQHWQRLGQPRSGPLRRVHFASALQGWGVAGGSDQAGQGPMLAQGATTLVHTSDGGQSWSVLAAPAPPQSVCFTSPGDGWLASGTRVWRWSGGGWGARPSFTLPVAAGGPAYLAELQCARPDAAWVRFSGGGAAAGHIPYALYASSDGGGHWRGVLAEQATLGVVLGLPAGPGSYPGPFSLIDPQRALLLSPTPPAGTVGAVMVAGRRLQRLAEIPGRVLSAPLSVSFASATRGWAVGSDSAGHAVIVATSDGGHHWQPQLTL
jgi:hypothetical protein